MLVTCTATADLNASERGWRAFHPSALIVRLEEAMQQMQDVFIGVDVGKACLSACLHESRHRWELPNEESAILAWLNTLAPQAHIAVESTGRYHQLLVRLVHASGRRAFVLNAQDVFFHARALGVRGKTDRKDAQVIAGYLAQHHASLRAWEPASATLQRLQQLLSCRAGIASKRSSLRQVLRDVSGLDASVQALERQFDELLASIDGQIVTLVDEDPQFSARCAKLRTITGIGAMGGAMLAGLFARLDFASADAVVAYSGLDPRPNDSGSHNGRRRISKRGSAQLRRQMYLAAFSAARSKALGPLYQAIKARGFKPTQALVILARKLLRVAFALWKSGKEFDASLVGTLSSSCKKT